MTLVLALICILLVPLAAAGLALIQQGLGRSRSASHAMLSCLVALSIAAICFVLSGASIAGFAGGPAMVLRAGGVAWDWAGAASLHTSLANQRGSLQLCLQMFTVGIAAIIPVGAGGDRWRLAGIGVSTVFTSALLYPLFAHWAWGGGWLTQLGTSFGLPPFTDMGGAGVIHVFGGLSALSIAWILGPRRGKYSQEGMAAAIPAHNIVHVLFGCMLFLVGWIGLEAASSLVVHDRAPEELVHVLINAMLSSGAGCLGAVLTTRVRYRNPDASLSANGWIAGLVAGSAACGLVSPLAAIVTGAVAGLLVPLVAEIFELKFLVDDPGGAISVHAGAGIWGLLALGLFQPVPGGTRMLHLLTQLIGIATLLGFLLPLLVGVNLLLDRFIRYRVDAAGDVQGMDIRELSAGAYPEFVVHADEFSPR